MTTKTPTIEDLTKVYIRIRDKRKEHTAEYEKADAVFKEQLATVEAALLARLDADKATSVKTEFGTVYKQIEIKPSANDWDAFFKWVQQDISRFEFLQKRITVEPIKTYMEENRDENDGELLPPGVSVVRQYVARVRAK